MLIDIKYESDCVFIGFCLNHRIYENPQFQILKGIHLIKN